MLVTSKSITNKKTRVQEKFCEKFKKTMKCFWLFYFTRFQKSGSKNHRNEIFLRRNYTKWERYKRKLRNMPKTFLRKKLDTFFWLLYSLVAWCPAQDFSFHFKWNPALCSWLVESSQRNSNDIQPNDIT